MRVLSRVGLVTALLASTLPGAGADFHDGVTRFRRVGRENAALNFLRQPFLFRFEAEDFLFRHARHFRG